MILLDKIKFYFPENHYQHGFKGGSSTVSACFVLKETILSYFKENSIVYAMFLDMSKAFDKINHEILFYFLHKCGVPGIYIKLIAYWYRNQFVQVEYGGFFSKEWKIRNGVRQGGILSPFFFKLYIHDLIERISRCKVGCRLGLFSSNIIAYADDIVLLAPSINALQHLANLISEEINKISLKFNSSKSSCMRF